MIYVDKQLYSQHDFELRFNELTKAIGAGTNEGKLFVICLKHPFDVVSTVLHVRDRHEAVLLLHGDTPLHTAMEIAERVDASYLFYENIDSVIPIAGSHKKHEPAILQYSSGTTGNPKLISRTWEDVDEETNSYNLAFDRNADGKPLILVPVSHSYGLISGVLSALKRGTVPVIVYDKNPKFALHLIQNTDNSIVYAVPYLFHILETLGRKGVQFNKLVSSGAPLSENLLLRLKMCTEEVWQQYGSTEVGCIALGPNPSLPTDIGTNLQHLNVIITSSPAVDDDDSMGGEIVVSSAFRTTATQDLGYWSPEGSLHVRGRMDDLINVAGQKVIPSEVELVIGRLDGIDEVVVYKIPHKIWGESAKALVVVSKAMQENDIKTWCLLHLPSFKVPSVIQFVDEIPKLPSGKVSRKLLQNIGV